MEEHPRSVIRDVTLRSPSEAVRATTRWEGLWKPPGGSEGFGSGRCRSSSKMLSTDITRHSTCDRANECGNLSRKKLVLSRWGCVGIKHGSVEEKFQLSVEEWGPEEGAPSVAGRPGSASSRVECGKVCLRTGRQSRGLERSVCVGEWGQRSWRQRSS